MWPLPQGQPADPVWPLPQGQSAVLELNPLLPQQQRVGQFQQAGTSKLQKYDAMPESLKRELRSGAAPPEVGEQNENHTKYE